MDLLRSDIGLSRGKTAEGQELRESVLVDAMLRTSLYSHVHSLVGLQRQIPGYSSSLQHFALLGCQHHQYLDPSTWPLEDWGRRSDDGSQSRVEAHKK